MRISGGEWGGRPLVAPKGRETRPTTDGNRQALFNILSHGFARQPVRVLDYFAGSGALSFEALSRGAERAVLVEKDRQALDIIRKNQQSLGIAANQMKLLSSARPEVWPAELAAQGADFWPFDLVFCDPPYGQGLAQRALGALLRPENDFLLSPDCLICVETDRRDPLGPFARWELRKERSKGDTLLRFLARIP